MVVGESARSRNVLRQIERVAPGRLPVLILGETGTGKEVTARNIYKKCQTGAFVTIDCSSLVGPLLESELFGHARGAFTGAVNPKMGLLEMADGGTAFFDEIGELPLDFQAKLLRALQEKEFRPVGSVSVKRSDFRIIAATNRDLAREVERGTFRRDLYYRLNVVTVRLSPLRERVEDIPPLVEEFITRYGSGHTVSPEVMELLCTYDWPGNVRELENCIQRMVAMNSGPMLTLSDMPSVMQNFFYGRRAPYLAMGAAASTAAGLPPAMPSLPPPAMTAPAMTDDVAWPLPPRRPAQPDHDIVPLFEVERRAIMNALHFTNGDRAEAANLLRIGRTTLYRKLKEYGVAAAS